MNPDDTLSVQTFLFPAPWDDPQNKIKPLSIRDLLYWCEYIYLNNDLIAAAMRRLASHFVTELEIEGLEASHRDKVLSFFYHTLDIRHILFQIALDYLVYGNCFVSIVFPIEKTVMCPKCNFTVAFEPYANRDDTEFEFKKFQIHLKCVHCGYKGPWEVTEKASSKQDDVVVVRWNVHDIDIIYDVLTGTADYIWRIPSEYSEPIKKGSVLHINRAPADVLRAIQENKNLKLNRDEVIHVKAEGPAGLRLNGWGLSPLVTSFNKAWLSDVLRRALQAIAYDYVVPLRILCPEPRSASPGLYGDAVLSTGLDVADAKLSAIIRDWRKNPTGWYTCPFPIRYQIFGAEASRIIPYQILELVNMDLISGMNIPLELFKGSLQIAGAPMALRLLENAWQNIPRLLNRVLAKIVSHMRLRFRWDNFVIRLKKPSDIEDINKQMAALQLAMGNVVSMTTGLRSIGLDFEEEAKRMIEEQKYRAKLNMQLQEELGKLGLKYQLSTPVPEQQEGSPLAALLGLAGGGGGGGLEALLGGGGGGSEGGGAAAFPPPLQNSPAAIIEQMLGQLLGTSGEPVSLDKLQSAAVQIANTLFQMHPSERKSALLHLKQKNPTVHALTIQHLNVLNNQAALQGKVSAQEQAAQQSQGASLPLL